MTGRHLLGRAGARLGTLVRSGRNRRRGAAGPAEGFVLRLTALGSNWTDGLYEHESLARRRAREIAARRPEITDAYICELRSRRVVRCHHMRLGP